MRFSVEATTTEETVEKEEGQVIFGKGNQKT